MEDFCAYDDLKVNEACVVLKSTLNSSNVWLYTLSSDCNTCPYTRLARLNQTEIFPIKINTAISQNWRIIVTERHDQYISASETKGLYCEFSPNVGEFGIYQLIVDRSKTCIFDVNEIPVNSYTPLTVAIAFLFLLLCSLFILKMVTIRVKRYMSTNEETETVENSANSVNSENSEKQRLQSLDTVRGMSILLMIFVNNGAGEYLFLKHATWNGLLVGDLVFPCFMWIMGVCIPLSVSSQFSRETGRFVICQMIVKRSVYLFSIGICLNTIGGNTQIENVRIFGVLQRLGVSYLVTGLIYALLIPQSAKEEEEATSQPLRDIRILVPQWIMAFVIILCHTAVIFLMPMHSCPKGYLGPGGHHADDKYWNCTGGATGYLDKLLLGENHIYQFPTANKVYESGPFDPEGVLGCLTSMFQVFLGIQIGQIICEYKDWKNRLLRWLIWALVLGIIGLSFHYTDIIPVNKNLWSLSFVLLTTSFSLGLLSACYLLIDVFGIWEGGPFRIPGMNALVMYMGHQIFFEMLPFHWKIGKMNSHGWLLAESFWGVSLWTCIAYFLHKKRFYLSL